jgi:hypothetical protein
MSGRSGGVDLSRHEAEFHSATELPVDARKVLDGRERQAVIACYLSASEGWQEAVKTLDGAFASSSASSADSKPEKAG